MRISDSLYFYQCLMVFSLLVFSFPSFSFDTLMTTPELRDELDRKRNKSVIPDRKGKFIQQAQRVNNLDFQGVVKRSNGPGSLWINGNFIGKQHLDGVNAELNEILGNAISVKLLNKNRSVRLKPGQSVTLDNGEIYENFQQDTLVEIPEITVVDETNLTKTSSPPESGVP